MLHSGPGAVADLGPLIPVEFKVSANSSGIFGTVACFAAPPVVTELFRIMPLPAMLWAIEANTAKVWLWHVLSSPSLSLYSLPVS